METILLDTSKSQVAESKIKTLETKLSKELQQLTTAATKPYDDYYSCLNAADDARLLQNSLELAEKYKGLDLLIVVGIGGSNLGTQAVQEALLGKLHSYTGKPAVLYADTFDATNLKHILTIAERVDKQKGKILANIITKSGTTAETVANMHVLIKALGWERIVVTTDADSPLAQLAEKKKIPVLTLPKNIGGRYSVLSPVSIFPLALLGIDVKAFLAGASSMRHHCLENKNNPATRLAAVLVTNKARTAELFVFDPNLEALGKWYRQLIAESLGKDKTRANRKTTAGINPSVAVGTTDLHSLAQLRLAGPDTVYTTLVHIPLQSMAVPAIGAEVLSHIAGASFSSLMDATLAGVQNAYAKRKRPYSVISMERSSHSIGEFMMLWMCATIYASALLDVDPFDQPAVELYKQETRKFLTAKKTSRR